MARELALSGIYFPSLLLIFIGAAVLTWIIEGLLARANWHRYLWHPPLFRLALFVCLFGGAGLGVYH